MVAGTVGSDTVCEDEDTSLGPGREDAGKTLVEARGVKTRGGSGVGVSVREVGLTRWTWVAILGGAVWIC